LYHIKADREHNTGLRVVFLILKHLLKTITMPKEILVSAPTVYVVAL
jgi:hypothetical protein